MAQRPENSMIEGDDRIEPQSLRLSRIESRLDLLESQVISLLRKCQTNGNTVIEKNREAKITAIIYYFGLLNKLTSFFAVTINKTVPFNFCSSIVTTTSAISAVLKSLFL